MIHYRLRCTTGHEFDGWFRDSDSFDSQAATGLLSCPQCGTTSVSRGLMAPSIRRGRPATPAEASPVDMAADAAAGREVVLPDAIRASLQKLRAGIERHCDDLGDRFADEAIRMRRGEIAERGIYGNATAADREALADEGIEVMQIPWLKPAEG